jgi:hypothetical protein
MSDVHTPPSRARILKATAAAVVAASVILVVAILPAEYGLDPLGTGRALGLTALSGTVADDARVAPAAPAPGGAPIGAALTPAALQEDTFEVELRPFEGVEYKYRMEQGASLVYSWTATANVGYEFHSEPDGAPAKYFDSYGKGEAAEAHGGFTAAKAGVHGWFWENKTAVRVKITLRTAGFYSASTEYRDGERIERRFPERTK